MKNNKGFTLIELVAIILILSLIFLVALPYIKNLSKTNNQEEYNKMVEEICLAGENYIYSNISDFNELNQVNSTINITVEELIIYGNVDKKIINKNTNKTIEKDKIIYTVLSDYTLNCDYIDG